MPRVLVTGAAGFIGSHVVELVASRGCEVVALDNFNSYYDPAIKIRNARQVYESSGVTVTDRDLVVGPLNEELEGVDVIVHLAGQPGVRSSWENFDSYVRDNISATEHLLRGALKMGIRRFVYASSSSVYGNAPKFPVDETAPTSPFSPYGVTKLAGEHLVRAYSSNFELTAMCLRFFTVYGPRQRPDMAFSRLIRSSILGEPFILYGDGSQVRDFTYVSDVVDAILLATEIQVDSSNVLNISGGSSVSMTEVVRIISEISGATPLIESRGDLAGDVFRTGGAGRRAEEVLGWRPKITLVQGIERQISEFRAARAQQSP